jgi:hypothetical protein
MEINLYPKKIDIDITWRLLDREFMSNLMAFCIVVFAKSPSDDLLPYSYFSHRRLVDFAPPLLSAQ